MVVMELTSFYQNVFYSSSVGEGIVCEEEPSYHHHQYSQAEISPAYSSHSSYSSYSPSPSSLSPQTCSSVSPPSELSYPASSPSPRQFGSRQHQKTDKIPKIPPLEVLQQRRLAANARERKRANKINFAFNRLRKVLPGFNDREISKFEAIQLARNYIAQLSSVLQTEDQGLERREAGQEHQHQF